MANWFPMALKDGACSWLLNLTEWSASSWEEMHNHFIANFQGTHDRPPATDDLRRIMQQPGETPQKYIQRFNNVRVKIPKVSDETIISAFTDVVRNVKMKEELAIHEDLCTALEMFNMANKCARAEEGRLSLLELPDADLEDKKAKTKDVKRKGPTVLAAEPETKRGCGHLESSKSNRPFCIFHNVHSHNTNDYQELGPSATDALVDTLSAMIEAMVIEVAEVEDIVTGTTIVRCGTTSLVRTAGRASLVRATRGSSLVRSALKATQLCRLRLHHQEGMKITTRTRGLGASRSLGSLLASWASHRPQLTTASSSSSHAR